LARVRLPSVVKRAKRIAGRRVRREFGERFLKRLGFDSDDFRKGGLVKKRLGLFGEVVTTSTRQGDSGPGPAPAVEQPQRETNEANPSITTIISQLDKLVKTANKVGILSKEQQEAMLGQLSQARRLAKEQILENKRPPIPEPADVGVGDSLTPLGDVIDELKKQLDKLTGKVKDKVEEQEEETDSNDRGFMERFMDRRGFGDEYRTRRRRRQARARRVTPDQLLDKNGNPLRGAARDSRIRRIQADRAAAAARGNFFTRMFKRTPGTAPAQAVTSSRIAQTISQGATRSATLARAGGASVKSAIRRAAGPIIAKGLGSTALKSIPLVGAVAGVGFAVDRLTKGDVLGAGLDLMSGLGGPLTAIPALVASTARDVYSSVYGVQPEADPEFNKRMPEVTSAVEGLVKEQLGNSVEPKQKPTQSQVDNQTVPRQPPQPPPVRETAPPLGTPPAPAPITSSPAPPGAASSRAASPSTDQAASATATQVNTEPTNTPGAPATIESTATDGVDIMRASAEPPVPAIPNMYGYNQQTGRFLPQTTRTSKSGHVGVGNVPNPDYIPSGVNNLPALYNVMFFNVNYQEQ
jgi:hypothetical protein